MNEDETFMPLCFSVSVCKATASQRHNERRLHSLFFSAVERKSDNQLIESFSSSGDQKNTGLRLKRLTEAVLLICLFDLSDMPFVFLALRIGSLVGFFFCNHCICGCSFVCSLEEGTHEIGEYVLEFEPGAICDSE